MSDDQAPRGIPVIWRSRCVGYIRPVVVSEYLPVLRFPVMPEFYLCHAPQEESACPAIETVEMRVVDRSPAGVPGELHVESLQHLRRLPDFSPEDRWLKLLAEADEA